MFDVRRRFGCGARSVVVALMLLGAGCGQSTTTDVGADDLVVSTTSASESPSDDTTEATAGSAAQAPPSGGLALRLTGEMADGLLCPGGQRPCFALDRAPNNVVDGRVRLIGHLVDGVVFIESNESPPLGRGGGFPDECEGKRSGGGDREEVFAALDGYRQSIIDQYAIQWVSQTNVFHFGVTGSSEDVEAAIAELGIGDDICVVGGFPKSEQELLGYSDEVGVVVEQWMSEGRMLDGFGWAPDPFAGVVSMDMFRIDEEMMASLTPIGNGLVEVNAAIEVLNGSLEDLEAALAAGTASLPTPDINLACGRVVFPAIPADLDGFAPLDADAEAALEGALAGPAGGEAAFFIEEYAWSIASRTDAELVLFGKPTGSLVTENDTAGGGSLEQVPYADMVFNRVGDDWVVGGFGQCRLEVSALGLGPASVILDPANEPDPTSTELPVLIRERDCANGEAPVGREIVPVVTESDSTIELIVLVAPVVGGANCPGNPLHPITISLTEPLGDRTVIDAATQPGVVRSWPPSPQDLDG